MAGQVLQSRPRYLEGADTWDRGGQAEVPLDFEHTEQAAAVTAGS